jgi:hypothetical protein
MTRAKKRPKTRRKPRPLTAAEERRRLEAAAQAEEAALLRMVHDQVGLWRQCERRRCRRLRGCSDDIEQCRRNDQSEIWKWLRTAVKEIRAGQSPRVARRRADVAVRPQMETIIFDFPGFGERYKMRVPKDQPPPGRRRS